MAPDENTRDVLVLNDREGNWFAIPREVVEQHRATGEQMAEIQKIFGDDVSGSAMAMGSQALGSQALDQQALGSQALGSQALNSQALGSQALNQQALSSQALGSQALQQNVLYAAFLSLPMQLLD